MLEISRKPYVTFKITNSELKIYLKKETIRLLSFLILSAALVMLLIVQEHQVLAKKSHHPSSSSTSSASISAGSTCSYCNIPTPVAPATGQFTVYNVNLGMNVILPESPAYPATTIQNTPCPGSETLGGIIKGSLSADIDNKDKEYNENQAMA